MGRTVLSRSSRLMVTSEEASAHWRSSRTRTTGGPPRIVRIGSQPERVDQHAEGVVLLQLAAATQFDLEPATACDLDPLAEKMCLPAPRPAFEEECSPPPGGDL